MSGKSNPTVAYVKWEEKSDVKRPWCEKYMLLLADVQIIQYTGLITGLIQSINSITLSIFTITVTDSVTQVTDFV